MSVVQQGIEQGAVGMPGGRVHDQTGWFVDHQQVFVFIDDVQFDVLRDPLALSFLLGIQYQRRASMHGVARTRHGAIDGQATFLDPGGKARTGELAKQLRSHLVEALTALFKGDNGLELDQLFVYRSHLQNQFKVCCALALLR